MSGAPSLRTPDIFPRPGAIVRLRWLLARPELNGRVGIALNWEAPRGRCIVALRDLSLRLGSRILLCWERHLLVLAAFDSMSAFAPGVTTDEFWGVAVDISARPDAFRPWAEAASCPLPGFWHIPSDAERPLSDLVDSLRRGSIFSIHDALLRCRASSAAWTALRTAAWLVPESAVWCGHSQPGRFLALDEVVIDTAD